MSKTFKYFKKTGEIYGPFGEWDGDDGYYFNYEVDCEDLLDVIVDLIYIDYFETEATELLKEEIKNSLSKMIKEKELFETLFNKYEEDLKDYYEQEALDSQD